MSIRRTASIVLRFIAAFLMVQTLYFKFTAQPESVYIFSRIGIEPWGRIGTGAAELIASVLLLIPATITIGAGMCIGIMLGAIATHIFILGIEVQGDGGQLFGYALVALLASIALLVIHFQQLLDYKKILVK